MLELIKQFKENEKQIKSIDKDRDKFKEQKDKEIYHLKYSVYEKQINKLGKERDKKIDVIQTTIDNKNKEIKQKIDELYEVIGKVKRIVGFLKINERYKEQIKEGWDLEIKNDSVKYYERDNGKHFEWLDYLFDDDLMKIRLLIAENEKPKNKYSLVALGKTIFSDDKIIKLHDSSYGVHLDTKERFNIESIIKNSASIEELKAYLSKNKDKILKELREQYAEVKKEYLEVIKTYSLNDFKVFEIFKEFRSLDDKEKEKVRQDYLKSINKKEWNYDRDRNKEDEFYEQNKEKYNFKILEIHNEKFY